MRHSTISSSSFFGLFLFLAIPACQTNRADTGKTAKTPEPVAPKAVVSAVLKASIASVSIADDCPDPEPAKEEAQAESKRRADEGEAAETDSVYGYAPCSQSTMTLKLSNTGDVAVHPSIESIVLKGPDGQDLGRLPSRLPMSWAEQGLVPWDGSLEPQQELQVSYKLSPPNWGDVQTSLQGPSHGILFKLEVTIGADGHKQTLMSPTFERTMEEMIET